MPGRDINEDYFEADQLLGETIVSLLRDKRFYFEILNRVVKRFSPEVRNMGLSLEEDVPVLTVNPEFFLSSAGEDRIAMLEHEILHLLFRHPLRLGDRDSRLFGIACDMAINQFLEKCPPGFILPGKIFKEGEAELFREAEYYYALLLEKGGGAVDGDTDDDHRRWEGEDVPAEYPPPEQRMKNQRGLERALKGALQAAGGKLPAHFPGNLPLEPDISESPRYRESWRSLLHRYLNLYLYRRSVGEVEVLLSKRRPHRKMGFPFPSLRAHPKRTLLVTVIIDVSGSISPEQFGIFMTEVQGIRRRDILVNLIFSDTDICRVPEEKMREAEISRLLDELGYREGIFHGYGNGKLAAIQLLMKKGCLRGRGGTSYSGAVAAAEGLLPPPDCIVYFTDSHDDGTLEAPSLPLIFVLTEKRKDFYPWAVSVLMEI